MDWSSGFFESPSDAMSETSSLELIHESEDGYSLLFRCATGGRYRLYKALKPEYRDIPVYHDLLRKEYSIGIQLDHPNIRRYLGIRHMEGIGEAIEMEWIDGVPLNECSIPDRKYAIRIIDELCDALEYVHRKQTIHRDIKPSNILITHNGLNLKLIDFGFSDADWCSILKTRAGTLAYASPELRNGGEVDCRTDIYSLGAVINGILPRNHGVSGRCMKEDRDKRFPTAGSVRTALHRRRTLAILAATVVPAAFAAFATIAVLSPSGKTVIPASEDPRIPAAATDTSAIDIEDVFNEATKLIIDAAD